MDPQLARVGAPFAAHRGSLEPDELAPESGPPASCLRLADTPSAVGPSLLQQSLGSPLVRHRAQDGIHQCGPRMAHPQPLNKLGCANDFVGLFTPTS